VTRPRPKIFTAFAVRRLPAKGTVRLRFEPNPAHRPEMTTAADWAAFERNPVHIAAAIAADEINEARTEKGRNLNKAESDVIIESAIKFVTECMPELDKPDEEKVRHRMHCSRAKWPANR
jgi:hypothetical protein